MNTKTMEGLVGARTNMNLLNTPMRVYKEARRKGDTGTMERAVGYANDFSDKAEEYKAKADEGMEEEAKEVREKAKAEREEAIRKRREERETTEEALAESSSACLLEISGEGKALVKEKDNTNQGGTGSDKIKTDAVKEPVTYTKTGEAVHVKQSADISVLV